MDALEDSWWPNSITESRPFKIPPSSRWLQRQDGNILTIQAGGDPVEYQTSPDCLPYLMLLDIVQLTYLVNSNFGNINHREIFYKGVIFHDNLRADFLASTQKATPESENYRASVPESMRRWICRFISGIPHDPLNRKHHAEILRKAYLEIDVFKYDFLGWSQTNERDLVSCLGAASDSLAMESPYVAEPLRWLRILRSQFLRVGLCTPLSKSKLQEQGISHNQPGEEERFHASVNPVNAIDPATVSSPSPEGISSSNLRNPPHPSDPSPGMEVDPTPMQLPSSPGRRPRGRPRRKAANIPREVRHLEPIRKLRSRHNTAEAVRQDPWANLANAPALTPLSPKKHRREMTLQGPPQPPGSTSGRAVRFTKNNQVTELGLQPTSLGKRSIIPPAGTSKIPCLVEKVEDPKTNDSDTKKNDSDTERTSVYSEHFKYIATMTSFRDTHFKKTIRKDLLSNPDESWKAFTSLSSAWRNASAENWDKLMEHFKFNVDEGDNTVKGQAIRNINRIYLKYRNVNASY